MFIGDKEFNSASESEEINIVLTILLLIIYLFILSTINKLFHLIYAEAKY